MSLESAIVVDEVYKFENEFNKSAVHFSPLLEASGYICYDCRNTLKPSTEMLAAKLHCG